MISILLSNTPLAVELLCSVQPEQACMAALTWPCYSDHKYRYPPQVADLLLSSLILIRLN